MKIKFADPLNPTNKFEMLAKMMFVSSNKERWLSYIKENFVAANGKSLEASIEVITRERELISQETSMNEKSKITRLIPSLKSNLK